MKVRFWGVRGSIPAPGPETNRYGGNTACVSVQISDGRMIIIDMGTGLMNLGTELMQREFGAGQGVGDVLLSHAHWDHIQGFGFFPPVFMPGNRFAIHGHARSAAMLEGILEGQMNPHFSPIYTLKNLGAEINFNALSIDAELTIGSATVRAHPNPHGSTTALAFRIEDAGRVLVYASDVGYPAAGPSEQSLALYRGAHLLIHDCTYTPTDRAERLERGFSSYADAADAAVAAGVEHLAMFHYDQDYCDDTVDELRSSCRAHLDSIGGSAIKLTAAAEGLELQV